MNAYILALYDTMILYNSWVKGSRFDFFSEFKASGGIGLVVQNLAQARLGYVVVVEKSNLKLN